MAKTKAERERNTRGIEIRRMGTIERGDDYHHVDGYSVFIDGKETQPWLTKREAAALANLIVAERRTRTPRR